MGKCISVEIIKYFWALRGLANKPFFAKFGKLSYIGKPVIIIGKKKISIGDKVRILPGIRMESYGGVPFKSKIIAQ